MIEPNWILVFSKKRGRWWVRLLACGRYHHVKAIAYLPAMRAWLFYDVKFNGTRLMLSREDDPGSRAFFARLSRELRSGRDAATADSKAFCAAGRVLVHHCDETSRRDSRRRVAPGPTVARQRRRRRQTL
ncbi:MAG: hypothetical protein WAO08_10805 [Hyphomicrobiaceae bacterium]